MGFKYGFKRFMEGRNGVDSFFYFTFLVYLVLFGLNLRLQSFTLYIINACLLIMSLFRLLSKNKTQRRKEAAVFDKIISVVLPNSSKLKRRLLEANTHTFHDCGKCGATLRIPRKRGKFNIICPKCKNRMTVRTWL